MQHKRLKLCTVFLLGLGLTGIQAQTMYIKQSSGEQTAYTLSNVRKMTFSPGNVVITKTDNSSANYAVAGLRYLSFTDFTTDIQQVGQIARTMQVYPNPVGIELNIDLPEAGTVQILSLDGKIMLTKQVATSGITMLAVEQLRAGIYLCRYNNGKETKTVKIIKQ